MECACACTSWYVVAGAAVIAAVRWDALPADLEAAAAALRRAQPLVRSLGAVLWRRGADLVAPPAPRAGRPPSLASLVPPVSNNDATKVD